MFRNIPGYLRYLMIYEKTDKGRLVVFSFRGIVFCPDFVVGQNRSDGEFDLYQIRKSSGPVVGLKSGGLVTEKDTCSFSGRFIHQFGLEFRPGYVFPTNSFWLAGIMCRHLSGMRMRLI